jgi:hypothetical protein
MDASRSRQYVQCGRISVNSCNLESHKSVTAIQKNQATQHLGQTWSTVRSVTELQITDPCNSEHKQHRNIHTSDNKWSYKSYRHNRLWRPIWLWDVEGPTLARQSAHRWRQSCQLYAPAALYYPETFSCFWYSFLLQVE